MVVLPVNLWPKTPSFVERINQLIMSGSAKVVVANNGTLRQLGLAMSEEDLESVYPDYNDLGYHPE